jgi:ureidoglycolate hydrolase
VTAGTRTIDAAPLEPSAWEPFGWLPLADTDPADGTHRMGFEWADPHVNIISHAADEIVHLDGGLLCDRLYRHDTHTQALLALDGPSVIAVAPPGADFGDGTGPDALDAAGSVRAFLLRPLQSLVLYRGTWHWGPFPLTPEPVHLYNVQGLGYRDDNASVDLAGLGLAFEVRATADG